MVIEVKVVPSSGKSGCILDKAGRLKCYLKSPAERNEANNELIKLFAKALKLTQNEVEIIAGATSRTKKLKIMTSMTQDEVLAHLGIQRQLSVW